jgi:hypothetical protein
MTGSWEPSELSLHGALDRIAAAMGASPMQDRVVRTLYGFLCDGKLVVLGDIENRNGTVLRRKSKVLPEDWQSSLSEPEFLHACGRRRVFLLANNPHDPLFVVNVRLTTSELDGLLSAISQTAQTPTQFGEPAKPKETSNATAPLEINKTGVAGRPSKSWHLIEPEFGRRWEASERYGDRDDKESPTKWAHVLIDWLGSKYPEAAAPKPKTLSNKLSPLLRTMVKARAARNLDIGRPK